jgi:hypothetical protein
MKTKLLSTQFKLFLFVSILLSAKLGMAQTAPTATQTFTHTGAVQQFTVPPCVGSMTIQLLGASGANGGSAGSQGGMVRGVMTATPGQVMNIYVGGQGSVTAGGFNGGGAGGVSSTSNGGGGGGATDIRLGGVALSNRIMVAAGGGGGGGNTTYAPVSGAGGAGSAFTSASGFGGGGAGGCATGSSGGESGGTGTSYGSGGAGGGFSSGGGGGGQGSSTGGWGCPGTLGNGGAGGGTSFICGGATGGVNGGGGGGGGYFGGGGGMTGTGGCNGGGAGGSSWAQTPMFSSITYTSGANISTAGHGSVLLIYAFNGSLTNATITPFAICQGQTATITAGGSSTYTWNTSSNSNSITVNPISNTTYTVIGTNSIGCVSSAVVTLTVNPGSPTLAINSSTNQICLGRTVTLTASGALTYTWSNNVQNGVTYTPSLTTTYTVQGQNGCGTTSAVTTVSVAPLAISVIANPTVVCANSASSLSAVSAGTTYTWMPFNLTGANVIVSPSVSTIYTVTASDGTCSGLGTVALLANPNPTVNSTISNTSICGGTSVTLTANGALGYTWTPGNLTGSLITVSPNAPIQYSVVGNNSIGCFGGSSQIVIVFPSPTLNINVSDPVICKGNASTLTVAGANTYTWGSGSNVTTEIVNPMQTSTYSVSGSFTSGAGCSSSTIITVNVFDPTLSITGATSTCFGGIVSLNASNAGTWQWNNGATSQGISVTPNLTSIYSVSALTSSGNINCPSSASIQIAVFPNPSLTATSSRSTMCKGETNTMSVTGASSYTWETGATSPTVVITPSLVTTLNYTVRGISNNGCTNTTAIVIKVNSCIGIEENRISNFDLKIYPNPSSDFVKFESSQDAILQIINELGQVIEILELNELNHHQATLTKLIAGIYFVKSNNELVVKKIIVEK